MDHLVRPRRIGVAGERRLILEWYREHAKQDVERREIVIADRGRSRFLDEMIARNEGRIGGTHGRRARGWLAAFVREAMAPRRCPIVECRRMGKQTAHAGSGFGVFGGVAKPAEGEG